MIKRTYRRALLLASIGLTAPAAFADRPNQDRQQASIVVTGYVRAVYARESEYNRHYVVEILIEQVEKGGGFRAGETLSVVCYQPKPATGKETDEQLQARSLSVDGGHARVPAEGDQVRAFATHFNGTLYEGIFPDWVDITKKAEPAANAGPSAPGPNGESPGPTTRWPWVAGALAVGLLGGFAAGHLRRSASARHSV